MPRAPRWLARVLSDADLEAIAAAIAEAESRTTGEIRVHVEATCPGDPLARAVALFESLGMHRTAGGTGVLIYLALEDHRLAVIGDRAIHARVGDGYWRPLADRLAAALREGCAREGLLAAVEEVGATLGRHFPRGPDDVNELPDQVSLGS